MNGAQLLQFLVSVPSVSGNERELADRLAEVLRGEGFAVEREGDNLWFSFGRNSRPHLLLLSHIDTVPACAGWNSDPLIPTLSEGKITGLGANDAKGCVAAMILAARALRTEPLEGKVTCAFVAQEERNGDGIRTVKPRLGALDAAVVGEPTSLKICTSQRGMLILRCTAHGKAAHAAHPDAGENAIHKAARDITRLAEMQLTPPEERAECRPQVTQISGGLARNQVPDRCEFFVDIRTTAKAHHAEVASAIGATLESEVIVHSSRYEAVATQRSERIVKAALIAAETNESVDSVTTSDWAFLKDVPAVKAGPGDTQRSHQPNEYLLLSELEAGAKFYSRLAQTYFSLAAKEVAHV